MYWVVERQKQVEFAFFGLADLDSPVIRAEAVFTAKEASHTPVEVCDKHADQYVITKTS